jgi:class 3 adenylate cyclase/YHS domain-containing protein
MAHELSITELSERTGNSETRLREWRSLGLIGDEAAERFFPVDVERAGLVALFLRRGISLEAIARAEQEGRLLAHYVDQLFPDGVPPTHSLAEAANRAGIGTDAARRFWHACHLGEQGEMLTDQDLEMLRMLRVALEAGFPEDALLQLLRVYADSLERVAEAETRLFHFYVHERMEAAGVSGSELRQQTTEAQRRLMPLVEPAIRYFHRMGRARAVREDAVHHLEEESGLVPRAELPGQLQAAIAFVDLSSFTPLAAAMGDATAAEVLDRFSGLVREVVRQQGGRTIKQIGDAFMLLFPDARSAVAALLEIEQRTMREAQFPAVRSGVHSGKVLYREGDYVGATVNLASRLASEAGRHQVLLSGQVRKEAMGVGQVEFVPLGRRRLKGLTEEVELFEARATHQGPREKLVDPVCGMELAPAEVVARLSLEGQERVFCSDGCLRRFVEAPASYARP